MAFIGSDAGLRSAGLVTVYHEPGAMKLQTNVHLMAICQDRQPNSELIPDGHHTDPPIGTRWCLTSSALKSATLTAS
jgi:hypothetical protein